MKKKTVIAVLIVLLLASTLFVFAGCVDNEDDGDFVVACEVQFTTTDGVHRSRSSTWKLLLTRFTENVYITDSESYAIESKYKLAESAFSSHRFSENFKTISSGLTENDIGKTVYVKQLAWGSRGWGSIEGKDYGVAYARYVFNGFEIENLSVKVVDENTIVIRYDGEDTTYEVSSYTIISFD